MKNKKILAIVIALVITIGAGTTLSLNPQNGQGRLSPNYVNRAEFIKLLVSEVVQPNSPLNGNCNTFSDVPANSWFAPYVCYAAQQGIVSGYSNGNFYPYRQITRAEAAKLIVSGLQQRLVNLNIVSAELKIYRDINPAAWYAPYVNTIAKYEIPEPGIQPGNNFSPNINLEFNIAREWTYKAGKL